LEEIVYVYNLNSACFNIRMIRTLRTVRTAHVMHSRYDKSTLEGKTSPSLYFTTHW